MKYSLSIRAAAVALAAALALLACASQKVPAEQAVAAVQGALDATRTEAAKYFPEKLAAADEALRNLENSLSKGDYAGVLATAPGLGAEVSALAEGVKQKAAAVKQALDESWTTLAAAVPDALQAVQSRIAALKKSHRLPKGVDTSAASDAWDKAKGAFAAGNVQEAVTSATTALSALRTAAAQLKLTLPGADATLNASPTAQ